MLKHKTKTNKQKTLFIRTQSIWTKHNLHIFGAVPFIMVQNDIF